MLIGNHFGKRKPQWNFFIRGYERFKFSASAPLARLMILSFIVQTTLFAPIVFWIYQNYSIIEKILPNRLNLHENIQFEKKWIVILIVGMNLVQSFWNYVIWKTFIRSERSPFGEPLNRATSASPDEVDYQRRAS